MIVPRETRWDTEHAQRVDVVVCYKLDRISRSIKDFHKILEILEENDVALVSVTQGLDTSTVAGKLLRNALPLASMRGFVYLEK